jgi:hypothetical protein
VTVTAVPPTVLPVFGDTAFTGTLLDLLHTGIPGGRELLTFSGIYPRLKHTVTSRQFPPPRQQGSDTIPGAVSAATAARAAVPGPAPSSPQPPPQPPVHFTPPKRIPTPGRHQISASTTPSGTEPAHKYDASRASLEHTPGDFSYRFWCLQIDR